MSFTTKQLRAIKYQCDTLAARPMLTIYPMVTLQVKATGRVLERHIDQCLDDWDAHLKERRQERSRKGAGA